MQFLVRTPFWVWPLLAALIALGVMQMRGRTYSRVRVAILPAVMIGLSIFGTVSTFGLRADVLAAWAIAAMAMLAANHFALQSPRGARADGTGIHVPGSVVPLLLILVIFCLRFFTGATQAINPALLAEPAVATAVAAILGLCSGAFLARAVHILNVPRAATTAA